MRIGAYRKYARERILFFRGNCWIAGGRARPAAGARRGPALCFIMITSIPGKAWTHATKFLLEFCLGSNYIVVVMSHVNSFNT